MCEFKSGIAVKLNECEVEVYTLPFIESHTLIREKHGIKENEGSLSDFSTPVELVPKRYPVKSFNPVDWKFVFDAGKPDWWTDSMTEQATSQLLSAARQDLENENEQEQLIAVKQHGNAIDHIKNPSKKVQLEAVKQNGDAIRFIKKPSKKVQLVAVKQQHGSAIQFITNPSEEVQLEAVKQYGYAIRFIKNPSEKVKLEAVKQNGNAIIHYITNPSEEVQLEAVKQNGCAIQFIENPSEAVKKAVKSS